MNPTTVDWVNPSHGGQDLRAEIASHQFAVVTGAPGAGKSRLIDEVRRMLELSGLEVVAPTMPPSVDSWNTLATRSMDLNHWEALWRAAILCSFVTFLNENRDGLSAATRQRLDTVVPLLPDELFTMPYAKHPYAVINIFASRTRAAPGRGRNARFQQPVWDRVEELANFASSHEDLPELLIQVDNLDNYFDNAPTTMAAVQAGLALYLVRQDKTIRRELNLRVHAVVRHTTRNFIVRHGGLDIYQAPTLVDIKWTKGSIVGVLESTVRSELPGLGAWTDIFENAELIEVPTRGTVEITTEYLLRHTTLTPRDANQLARGIVARHRVKNSELSAQEVRYAVAEYSEILAATTVYQLVSDIRAMGGTIPRAGVDGAEARSPLESTFRQMIERGGSDALTRVRFLELIEDWDETSRPFVSECIWAYRLIGQHDVVRKQLRISRAIGDRLMPEYDKLLLHPILLDYVAVEPMREAYEIEYV